MLLYGCFRIHRQFVVSLLTSLCTRTIRKCFEHKILESVTYVHPFFLCPFPLYHLLIFPIRPVKKVKQFVSYKYLLVQQNETQF